MSTPVTPSVLHIKVGFEGIIIIFARQHGMLIPNNTTNTVVFKFQENKHFQI